MSDIDWNRRVTIPTGRILAGAICVAFALAGFKLYSSLFAMLAALMENHATAWPWALLAAENVGAIACLMCADRFFRKAFPASPPNKGQTE